MLFVSKIIKKFNMRYIEVKNLNCKLYGPKYHCRIKPVKIDKYIDTV